LKHCEDAVVFTDAALRVWYANDAFAALSGRAMYAGAGTAIVERSRIASRTAKRSHGARPS
jgi:hypothetical protein